MDTEQVNPDVQEAVVEPTSQPQTQQAAPSPGSAEYNFREMRAILERQAQELQQLRIQQSAAIKPQEEKPLYNRDELPDWDNIERYVAHATEKTVQGILKQQPQLSQEDLMRLKNPDYDAVVSEENIKELFSDPELTEDLRNSKNPYRLAYNLIKRGHKPQSKIAPPKVTLDAKKVAENLAKPVTANVLKQAASMGEAGTPFIRYSEADKKRVYLEMAAAARRAR